MRFAELLKLRVLGIIENMSYLVCPKCGERIEVFSSGAGRKIAEAFGVPLLGEISPDSKISKEADSGMPFVVDFESQTSRAFGEIVRKIEERLKKGG